MSTGRCAASCAVLMALVCVVADADADDPFENLPSPTRPATNIDRGDRIRLSGVRHPEAPDLAPRFPPTGESLPGAPYSAPALSVLRIAPRGTDVRTDTVLVEFNQPMVDLDSLDAPRDALMPISISPVVPGRTVWLGTATAAFQVEGGLPGDTDFTVLVPTGLEAPSGRRLERRFEWTFRTASNVGGASAPSSDPEGPPTVESPPSVESPIPTTPLPILEASGSLAAPVPVLEAALTEKIGFPDVLTAAGSTAVAPGGTLDLSVSVLPRSGEPRPAGLTITGISEETGEVCFRRGDLTTDPTGHLSLQVPAPDIEGFYRWYFTAADDQLGVAVADLRVWVRVPLAVRADLPPHTRAGDRFAVGAWVRNLAHDDREVLVRIRVNGGTAESDPVRISLAAGEVRRVRVGATTPTPGDAVFQIAAATTSASEERALVHHTVTVPVRTNEPVQRTATYGIVDRALRVPYFPPAMIEPEVGGLEVSVTADPQLILTDALLHILEAEAVDADRLGSRILALGALGKSRKRTPLSTLPPDLIGEGGLDTAVRELVALQHADGGFGPSTWTDRSHLSVSARCATALLDARAAGVELPDGLMESLAGFLKTGLDDPGPGLAPDLRALMLRALAGMDIQIPDVAADLYLVASGRGPEGRYHTVPLQARAWLMEAFHALDPSDVRIEELYRGILGVALERGDGVSFPAEPEFVADGSLRSPEITDAVVLHALLTTRPTETLIPRIASGLIGAMRNGHWSTPRADAWAIQALALYYDDLDTDTPSCEARAWLDDRMILGRRYRKTTHHARGHVPMPDLRDLSEAVIRISKRGDGTLFYRIAQRWVPSWVPVPPRDHGLRVDRTWSLVDATRAMDSDGSTINIREGDLVLLRGHVVTAKSRKQLVVDIPIPCGLRVLPKRWDPTIWDAMEETEQGIRLFRDLAPTGVHEYQLTLHAKVPGFWRGPPIRAQALRSPGVSGSSAGEEIIITARDRFPVDFAPGRSNDSAVRNPAEAQCAAP